MKNKINKNYHSFQSIRGHKCSIFSVDILKGNKFVATGSEDSSIKIWKAEFYNRSSEIKRLSLTENKKDNFLKLKRFIHFQTLSQHTEAVRDLKFIINISKQKLLISCSEDHSFIIWKLNSSIQDTHFSPCQIIKNGHNGKINCLDFEGNFLFTGSSDNSIKI